MAVAFIGCGGDVLANVQSEEINRLLLFIPYLLTSLQVGTFITDSIPTVTYRIKSSLFQSFCLRKKEKIQKTMI